MSLVHDAVVNSLKLLVDAGSSSFEVDRMGMDVFNGFSIVVPYCCKVAERRDMSCIKHSVPVTRACRKCLVPMDYIRDQ